MYCALAWYSSNCTAIDVVVLTFSYWKQHDNRSLNSLTAPTLYPCSPSPSTYCPSTPARTACPNSSPDLPRSRNPASHEDYHGPADILLHLPRGTDVLPQFVHEGAHALPVLHLLLFLLMKWPVADTENCGGYPYPSFLPFLTTWNCFPQVLTTCSDPSTTVTT